MKLAVEFPHTLAERGVEEVAAFAQAAERIGFDQLDTFDHVVMAFPADGRAAVRPAAGRLEALATLTYAAAVTEHIGLGTEVLVLPQRQPALVAQQVATLDILSAGRVRLGVGVGWQAPEFEALGIDFHMRGRATDEAIDFLRLCWREHAITFEGRFYAADAVSMEPKPVQPGGPPVWVGGNSRAALRRAGRLGDGWLAGYGGIANAEGIATVRRHAELDGHDPAALGFQRWLRPLPRAGDPAVPAFYRDPAAVAAEAAMAADEGFDGVTVNATGIALSGAESASEIAEGLQPLHDAIRAEVG